MNNNPIGIFDSGIGGLTVTKQIMRLLPKESIIYLGDTARVPYGTRSKEIIQQFAQELVRFLLKKKVKVLVAACNTISAVALDQIKSISPVPVLGVLEPTSSEAYQTTKNKKIAVIGTTTTINSQSYKKELTRLNPDINIISVACPLFVPLAEAGLGDHEAAKILAKKYLRKVKNFGADTLILGCTHYPLLGKVIQTAIGAGVHLVDCSKPTAESLRNLLNKKQLLSNNPHPIFQFFVTDAPARTASIASNFFGSELKGKIKKVTL